MRERDRESTSGEGAERERERARETERERERDRIPRRLSAASTEPDGGAQTHEQQDHDLS